MHEYRNMCATVRIWRSKNNLGGQSSPSAWFEPGSLTPCCMCQTGMPMSSWRFSSLHFPSCQRHADYSRVLTAGQDHL